MIENENMFLLFQNNYVKYCMLSIWEILLLQFNDENYRYAYIIYTYISLAW